MNEKDRKALWAKEHPESRRVSSARYYENNKPSIKARNKTWADAHPEVKQESVIRYREKCLNMWMELLKERDMTSCIRCGYDKCFAAIEFHHLDPNKKKFSKTKMLKSALTRMRLDELDKIIPLCANCHRELHNGVWEVI